MTITLPTLNHFADWSTQGRLKTALAVCSCGAREGELHEFDCSFERCTQCSEQFFACDCPEPRKRVPFVRLWWRACERCGEPSPDFFNVPDDVWRRYVLALGDGDKLLCEDCFRLIAQLVDGGDYMRSHGEPVLLKDIQPDAPPGSPGRERWDARKREQEEERILADFHALLRIMEAFNAKEAELRAQGAARAPTAEELVEMVRSRIPDDLLSPLRK
jgi:hypothetical protein